MSRCPMCGKVITRPKPDRHQQWIDEVQKIVKEFVQNDNELGELMLDRSERFWDECFREGLSPKHSLNRFIARLSS